MGKLKSFSIAGMGMWFWSSDHEPPHFHAKMAGSWEVSVRFLEGKERMFEIKWQNKPFASRQRKLLEEMVRMHRDELLKEWEEKVRQP